MKAVYAEQPFAIGMRDIPMPEIGREEVLIKVAYAGVCGSDLHAYRGVHAFRKPPVMLGHELSGTVAALGEAVTGLALGQPVTVMPQVGCGECAFCKAGKVNLCTHKTVPGTPKWIGTFGEFFPAPAAVVCPLDGVPLSLGAMAEPLAVANHVMRQMPEGHGRDLTILGAGAIGLLLLIIAPHYGFERVLMTDIADGNLELARRLGAFAAVNVAREDAAGRVREAFGDDGVENVIIAAGGTDILGQAIQMARPGGNIVYFAMVTREMTLNTYPIVFKELHLSGSLNYTLRDFSDAIGFLKKEQARMEQVVTHVLPLSEAGRAFEILDKRTEHAVKILLKNG